MSRASSSKRKKPETNPPGLMDGERAILDIIKSREDLGISEIDIKQAANIPETSLRKLVTSLLSKNLIKKVTNVQNKRKRHYIASEFKPSKEVSGGDWYGDDGNLDKELIGKLKNLCHLYLSKLKVATLDAVHGEVKKSQVVLFDLSLQQTGQIMKSMVLDKIIIEVKSTGLEEYRSIPIGSTCYRVASSATGPSPRFASLPCAACPRISLCTPDGAISPSTCVYYTKWLDIEF